MPLYREGDPATWTRTFEEELVNLIDLCGMTFREAQRLTLALRRVYQKVIRQGVVRAAKVVLIELGLDEDDGSRRYITEANAVELHGEPLGTYFWTPAPNSRR